MAIRFAAFAAVLLVLAGSAAAKKESMLFGDYLNQGKATTRTASAHYKPLRFEKVTFPIAKATCPDDDFVQYDLICPAGNDYDSYGHKDASFSLTAETIVANCQIDKDFFDTPIELPTPAGTTGLEQEGTWTGTCQLLNSAEHCAEPLCEGATVVVSGNIYEIEGVLIEGNPAAPSGIGCAGDGRKKREAAKKKDAVKAANSHYGDHSEATFEEANVELLWGTIQSITTPDHTIPATGGYIQIIDDVWSSDPFTGDVDKRFIVTPYNVQFKLAEPVEYEKHY